MERLGIFGGTFDPIHVGHLVAAVNARHALGLDRVLLVVANQPWQKSDRAVTPAEQRLALVQAAVEGAPGLEASRLEIDRGGDSYTADTLGELAAGDRELFLVVGADVAAELHTWEQVEVVRRLATLVIVNRPARAAESGKPARAAESGKPARAAESGWLRTGRPHVGTGWRVETVEIPQLEISSSDLRARAADGRPLDHLVPRSVINRIRESGLYSGGR